MTWSSVTSLRRQLAPGRPGPAACCSRSPQIATLATPGTRSRRAGSSSRRSSTCRSATCSSDDDADLHDPAGRRQRRQHDRRRRPGRQRRRDVASRSCTSWRAASRSVPGLKMQLDRRELRHRLRAQLVERRRCRSSACSSGTVTRPRPPSAESPRQTVWISTCGGANSGNTSTGMSRSCATPKTIIAAAERDDEEAEPQARRDDPAHHRRAPRCWSAFAAGPSLPDAELGAAQLGRADRDDRRAGRRARPARTPRRRRCASTSIGSRLNTSGSGLV